MRDADEFDLEDADIDDVTRLDAGQQHVAEQLMFFEFAFSEAVGEVGAVNGNVETFEDVRQCTEMIFVTVREDDGGDIVAILVEEVKIRYRDVYAVSRFFGKAHPGVENQHLVAVPHCHTIHSKLADTAEWYDLEDTSHRIGRRFQPKKHSICYFVKSSSSKLRVQAYLSLEFNL